MESISLEDLDEVDLLLTELEISQGKRNLILCVVASPAYREKIIKVIKSRFSTRITSVETGDNLISDLRNIKPKADKILIWTLPETLSQDVLDALNNFRELFYDAGVPSLIFMTPAGLDGVIWKAPDFWRYRGGYHILKGEDHGEAYQAVEALSIPLRFSYRNKEDLLRRERINEYLLEKIRNKQEREKILAELGSIHSFLGDTGKSIYYFDQALEISRQIGDRQGEASNLAALGQAYVNPGEIRKAIEYFDQALEISRQIGDRQKEGASLASLGQAYAKLGESSKAIKYIEQALMISRQIGDRQKEGASLAALGRTYANLGMMHLAIGCYELQLRIAQEIGFIRSEGDALWNMSLALDQLGKKAQAIESAKAALKILGDIEDPQAENVRRKLQEWESQQQKQ
jgi:tetratricopeptide (TPR) repeat protein